jgi:ribosome-associated translation inhibitor RaiA
MIAQWLVGAMINGDKPWLEIILAIIGASGGVLAAVLTFLARKRVDTKIDTAVGIPNGHGPLMAQTTTLLQNQMQISQNVFDLNEKFNDHIISSNEDLNTIHVKVDSLADRLHRHLEWEENGRNDSSESKIQARKPREGK